MTSKLNPKQQQVLDWYRNRLSADNGVLPDDVDVHTSYTDNRVTCTLRVENNDTRDGVYVVMNNAGIIYGDGRLR